MGDTLANWCRAAGICTGAAGGGEVSQHIFRKHVYVKRPDGAMTKERLPDMKRVKHGGMANILVMVGGHLVVMWFRRVKGGWAYEKV